MMTWTKKATGWPVAYATNTAIGSKIYSYGGQLAVESLTAGVPSSIVLSDNLLQFDYTNTYVRPIGEPVVGPPDYTYWVRKVLGGSGLILAVSLAASTAIGNSMFIAGGSVSGAVTTNQFFQFTPPATNYVLRAAMPSARAGGGLVSIGTKAYFIGGYSGSGTAQSNFWEWNQSTNIWTIKSSLPFGGIYFHGCVAIGPKIYVIGGRTASAFAVNTLYEWDQLTDTWSTKSSMPITLNLSSAVTSGTKIYMIGGLSANSGVKPFLEWDQTTDSWTALEDLPNERSGMGGAIVDGRIFVAGGQFNVPGEFDTNMGYASEVYEYQIGGTSGWKIGSSGI